MPPTSITNRSPEKGTFTIKESTALNGITQSLSKDILHHYHKDEHYKVLILFLHNSPDILSPMANIAVASSLALLDRTKGALFHLVQLADTAGKTSVRKLYLYALYRLLEETGTRNPAFAFEVEKGILEEESFKYVPLLRGIFFTPRKPQSTYEQITKYTDAGGVLPPLSFSAAVIRDEIKSRRMKELQRFRGRIFEAVEEFGPWQSSANVIITQFRENTAAMDKLYRLSGTNNDVDEAGLLKLAEIACVRANLAIVSFLSGNLWNCCTWCERYLAITDRLPKSSRPEGLVGLACKDSLTIAMIHTTCLDEGLNVNASTLEEMLSRILNALPNPKRKKKSKKSVVLEESIQVKSLNPELDSEFYQSYELKNGIQTKNPLSYFHEPPFAFPLPMRQSQFFSCCGHLRRHLAAKAATVVHISSESSKKPIKAWKFNSEKCIEAARSYMLASACHPLDDCRLYRLYDRVIWALCLAGGIHVRLMWLLLNARNHASYTANFVPALRRKPTPSRFKHPLKSRRPQSASLERKRLSEMFLRVNHSKSSPALNKLGTVPECSEIHTAPLPRPMSAKERFGKIKIVDDDDEVAAQLSYGASLSPWPNYQDGEEILNEMARFVEGMHKAVEESPGVYNFNSLESYFLTPSIFENPDHKPTRIYMANEYLPTQKNFDVYNGFRLTPQLRSQLKIPSHVVAERNQISKELARLWAESYEDKHGKVPSWAKGVLEWAEEGELIDGLI